MAYFQNSKLRASPLASSNYGVVGTHHRVLLPSKLSIDKVKNPFGDLKNTPFKAKGFLVPDMTVHRATPTVRPSTSKANDVRKATSESTGADVVVKEVDETDFRNERIFSMLDENQFNLIFMDAPKSAPPSPPSSPAPVPPLSPRPSPNVEMESSDASIDIPSLDSGVDEFDDLPPINLSLIEFD